MIVLNTANSLLKGLVLQPTPEKQRKVSKETTDKLQCLPSYKHKKRLSLYDQYKKWVGNSVKASSQITIQPEGKCVSKSCKKELMYTRVSALARKSEEVKQSLWKKWKWRNRNSLRKTSRLLVHSCSVQLILIKTSDDRMWFWNTSENWLNDTIVNCTQNCLYSKPSLYDTSLGPHLTYPKAQLFTRYWMI